MEYDRGVCSPGEIGVRFLDMTQSSLVYFFYRKLKTHYFGITKA